MPLVQTRIDGAVGIVTLDHPQRRNALSHAMVGDIVAALAVKRTMEREKLPGTIMIWPGIAEEQLGTKAYYVRSGLFKDVDLVMYNHVGSNLSTSWGDSGGNGLISVEYDFEGETAHSAGAPWRSVSTDTLVASGTTVPHVSTLCVQSKTRSRALPTSRLVRCNNMSGSLRLTGPRPPPGGLTHPTCGTHDRRWRRSRINHDSWGAH